MHFIMCIQINSLTDSTSRPQTWTKFVFTQQSSLVRLALAALVLFAILCHPTFSSHISTSCFPGDLLIFVILASFTAAPISPTCVTFLKLPVVGPEGST